MAKAGMAPRTSYGVDAPGDLHNLLIIGAAAVVCAWLVYWLSSGAIAAFACSLLAVVAALCFCAAVLMVGYAKYGKFHHRDRMLAFIRWRGDERVLDIGTGLGLLLVGAAKRLTTGRAIGLDIWDAADLSGNVRERTIANLVAEGVADRCDLIEEPAQALSLPDSSVDVVLSNLCLHNIGNRAERGQACRHIARVLKAGGCTVISDFRYTRQYGEILQEAGLSVSVTGPYFLSTFPPLRIVYARKG